MGLRLYIYNFKYYWLRAVIHVSTYPLFYFRLSPLLAPSNGDDKSAKLLLLPTAFRNIWPPLYLRYNNFTFFLSYFLSFLVWPLLCTLCRCRGYCCTWSHSTTRTFGRTPLDNGSARRRDLYLTTHNTYKRQTSMPPKSRLFFEDLLLYMIWGQHIKCLVPIFIFR
jgi:hypothetical protein